MTPPVLPGEMWRGDVDGPVCVTVRDGEAFAWHWRNVAKRWSPSWEWRAAAVFSAWALSLRADAQRAAERMREACVGVALRVAGETPRGTITGNALAIANEVRRLSVPAPTSPPPCSCPDRIAAGTPTRGDRGRPWRYCPWCARPLPDEAASLHVPGCARVGTEGAGHPGACAEPGAANDREVKP